MRREFLIGRSAWIDQQLHQQVWKACVPGEDSADSGEIATRTVTANGDTFRISAKIGRMGRDPLQCSEAVFNAGRKFMFRRQSISYRSDMRRPAMLTTANGCQGCHDVATAMQPTPARGMTPRIRVEYKRESECRRQPAPTILCLEDGPGLTSRMAACDCATACLWRHLPIFRIAGLTDLVQHGCTDQGHGLGFAVCRVDEGMSSSVSKMRRDPPALGLPSLS
jgi:hypothetical protein